MQAREGLRTANCENPLGLLETSLARGLLFGAARPRRGGMKDKLLNGFSGIMIVAALSAGVLGCDNEPAAGKAQASVAPATSIAPTTTPRGAPTYAFSNEGSEFGFIGAKVTGKHEGTFEKFEGQIKLVDNDPTKSSVTAQIDPASISVEPAKLEAHLKSPDFLNVQKFPKATFQSTSIQQGGAGGATHTVTGNLTLLDKTRSISFPANIRVANDTVKIDSEFAINRKDFGIVYPGMPDDLIKDDVLIKLKLNAKRS